MSYRFHGDQGKENDDQAVRKENDDEEVRKDDQQFATPTKQFAFLLVVLAVQRDSQCC